MECSIKELLESFFFLFSHFKCIVHVLCLHVLSFSQWTIEKRLQKFARHLVLPLYGITYCSKNDVTNIRSIRGSVVGNCLLLHAQGLKRDLQKRKKNNCNCPGGRGYGNSSNLTMHKTNFHSTTIHALQATHRIQNSNQRVNEGRAAATVMA